MGGLYPSVELEIGIARCANVDNYNKKVGRLKSKGRMKPQGFWVKKYSEDEIILLVFDTPYFKNKIPELVLRKSPLGGRVYFIGVL